ncbi:hypothetical protein B0H94_106100 [Salsuginibacillus halophilus]|uniref:Uncharacterized protein n=1 Tax=Salsuginibacillus halophilus TaxID=517424 RepID=A0A2P8HHY5_9BACI|nr:hypothetical protein [Salsuginibacillus halophilus]PSL45845.1 hypothetical protein B0H94_106100 [Salsuginibacillus halophilus]
MGQYYIDHYNQEIHHTSFVNDRCAILHVNSEHRATVRNEREIEKLLKANGYAKCDCLKETDI